MSNPPSAKPYWEMTADELAAATTEFDAELVVDQFGDDPPDLSPRERDVPPGQGVTVVTIGLEPALVARLDRLAATRGVSRSALMTRGVQAVLAAEGEARAGQS